MHEHENLPSLEGWESTRETLHTYAKVAGAPARILAEPHPKWWHVSLEVTPEGLISKRMNHEALGERDLRMLLSLRSHALQVLLDGEVQDQFPLTNGQSATEMGLQLQARLASLGVVVELPEDKYANDEPRLYDRGFADRYLRAVNQVAKMMGTLRGTLLGDRSPVQLWPHHFDLAFEWFGSKKVTYEEDGEQSELPAQLNFGFAPGDSSYPDPYFYSNPWPFDEQLTTQSLPHGARWFTDGFKGSLLPYSDLVGDQQAADKLLSYYQRVFELARPILTD
jgi:hypothetical protein